MGSFIEGVLDYLAGVKGLVTTPRLWLYVWIPLIINTIVYCAVFGVALYFFGDLMEAVLPEGSSWYLTVLRYMVWFVFALVAGFAVCISFFAVANLIASPFNEMLSRKYEALTSGKSSGSGLSIRSTVTQEIKRLVVYAIILVILIILTAILAAIPFLNLIVPIIWALFTSFILSFEFLSYTLDRKGMVLGEKLGFMRGSLMRTLGFGFAASLSLVVPVVNLAVIPCAVVGATRLYIKTTPERNRLED